MGMSLVREISWILMNSSVGMRSATRVPFVPLVGPLLGRVSVSPS